MIYASEADIVPLLENLVNALQPYAKANHVSLSFSSKKSSLQVAHEPHSLLQSLSHIICQATNLVPHKSSIEVRLQSQSQDGKLVIEIENNGINLIPVSNIVMEGKYNFTGMALTNGTIYRLELDMKRWPVTGNEYDNRKGDLNQLPQFYAEIRKRLRSHFIQSEKLVAALSETRPMEATFLQKINALIKANLHDEYFDTNALCIAMAMSRTQLFRRLKPLIRQAPATYIKTMRLQRAKDMLDTTDLTISEVAFKCGFVKASHFTRVFQQQYGLPPSLFRRNRNATNE